jgi:hypothetical protein
MIERLILLVPGSEITSGIEKRMSFPNSRARSHPSNLLWPLITILTIIKSVNGTNLCTESSLVGTLESGHYEFYNDSFGNLTSQETTSNASTVSLEHSFLRNRKWPDTLDYLPLSLVPNITLELRIASYNIRAAFPEDRGSDCTHPFGWEARVDQVSEQINFYHPDIIGIQEDTHYQIKQLESYLPDYRYVGVNRDDCQTLPEEAGSPLNPFGVSQYQGDCAASKKPDALVRGGEFNSIWFRPDVVDLQSWGVFWLGSETAKQGSHFLNFTCKLGNFSDSCDVGRVVTWARFRPKDLPFDFFVFNTHVTSNSEGNKKTPETFIRKVQDIAGSKLSYALGDFATAQFSERYKIYQNYLNDPDNPHPNETQALRQWPPEANNDFRRGGRVDPPYGTGGPFVDTEGAVYDFIWGHHIKILSMLNDRLRNTTAEERRRVRSDHRMLLATVELKPEYFFQNGHAVQYPTHLARSDDESETSTSASARQIFGFIGLGLFTGLSCWLSID